MLSRFAVYVLHLCGFCFSVSFSFILFVSVVLFLYSIRFFLPGFCLSIGFFFIFSAFTSNTNAKQIDNILIQNVIVPWCLPILLRIGFRWLINDICRLLAENRANIITQIQTLRSSRRPVLISSHRCDFHPCIAFVWPRFVFNDNCASIFWFHFYFVAVSILAVMRVTIYAILNSLLFAMSVWCCHTAFVTGWWNISLLAIGNDFNLFL